MSWGLIRCLVLPRSGVMNNRSLQFQVPRAKFQDSGMNWIPRGKTPDGCMGGFTLLEVMVALAILGIGIVTVLELFSGSLRLGVKASRYTQAAIYAQNVMNRFFSQNDLNDGEENGELPGGYTWRARVQEIHPDEDHSRVQRNQGNSTDVLHLKEIEVSMTWREESGSKSLVLHSLRTVTEQPIQ